MNPGQRAMVATLASVMDNPAWQNREHKGAKAGRPKLGAPNKIGKILPISLRETTTNAGVNHVNILHALDVIQYNLRPSRASVWRSTVRLLAWACVLRLLGERNS